MRDIALFGEDVGHEFSLSALITRFAVQHDVTMQLKTISSRGGITKVHHEFDQYLSDIQRGRIVRPDLIVVATDSNCIGYAPRRHQIEKVAEKHPGLTESVAYAIPDPHIERWLLADPEAFRDVVGKGCTLPKLKCNKDEYKNLLYQSVRDAGVRPVFGGLEYAEEIMKTANLARIEKSEPSFERTTKQIKSFFKQWQLNDAADEQD
jgi:hypothetical protein